MRCDARGARATVETKVARASHASGDMNYPSAAVRPANDDDGFRIRGVADRDDDDAGEARRARRARRRAATLARVARAEGAPFGALPRVIR